MFLTLPGALTGRMRSGPHTRRRIVCRQIAIVRPLPPRPGGLRRAFTLIELLVVVAIIAVLAALLLPSLRQAMDRAREAACVSNVRQIVTASRVYLSDHNDTFFEYVGSVTGYREFGQGGTPSGRADDPRPLNDYLGDYYAIFRCPVDNGRAPAPYAEVKPTLWHLTGSSYMFNIIGVPRRWATSFDNPNPNIANQSVSIYDVTKFVLFLEYPGFDLNWEAPASEAITGWSWPVGLAGSGNFHEPYYQNPSSTFGYADGHVVHLREIKGKGRRWPEALLTQ